MLTSDSGSIKDEICLSADEQEIRDGFENARMLKDVARASLDQTERYLEAATLFQQAALLSQKLGASAETDPEEKVQHLVFAAYYSYEEHYCLGAYYYEQHKTVQAKEHHQFALHHLNVALEIIDEQSPNLTDTTKQHLARFADNWQHFRRQMQFHLQAVEARSAWDDQKYIEALDLYRVMGQQFEEWINDLQFRKIAPEYQRIAAGNFIGTMANVSSALAANVLSKARDSSPNGERKIRFDLLVKLVKYTLDAYRLCEAGYEQNPEWDQYHKIGQQCLANIQVFLRDNPGAGERLAAFLHDDQDFIRIWKLKTTMENAQTPTQLKILFVAANPLATTRLQLDEEMRAIEQKVYASTHRDNMKLVIAGAARPDDLLQAMNRHKPDVVHFSGHGSPSDEIILTDDAGNSKPVSKEALVALFDSVNANVKLVVLNSCYSKSQAKAIVSVVPCAVGMKDTIGDEAARVFSASFYRAIGFGNSIAIAFKQGLAALKLEGIPEDSIPELIAQSGLDPDALLLIQTPHP